MSSKGSPTPSTVHSELTSSFLFKPPTTDSKSLASSFSFLNSCYEYIKRNSNDVELAKKAQLALDLLSQDDVEEGEAFCNIFSNLLTPLLQGCTSRNNDVCVKCIDSLSLLVSHELIPVDFSNQKAKCESYLKIYPEKSPCEKILLCICQSFEGELTDSKIETHLMRAVLNVVSSKLEIHEEVLLNSVRTLYNIFLLSKNQSSQTVCQVTLIQIIQAIFSKFEDDQNNNEQNEISSLCETPEMSRENSTHEFKETIAILNDEVDNKFLINEEYKEVKSEVEITNEKEIEQNEITSSEENKHPSPTPPNSANLESTKSANKNIQSETIVTTENESPEEINLEKESVLENKVKDESFEDNTLENKHKNIKNNKVLETLSNDDHIPIKRIEKSVDMEAQNIENKLPKPDKMQRISSSYKQTLLSEKERRAMDGFFLIRSLTRLSSKPYNNDSTKDFKRLTFRSKLLSLHLILYIISNYHDKISRTTIVFKPSHDKNPPKRDLFYNAIKPYLCLALSKNLVSNIPKIFEITVCIFSLVVYNIRHVMKNEIEVFMKEIVLPFLEANNVENLHSEIIYIILFITKIAQNPQILVDIYINYDCDRNSLDNNIFERVINVVCKSIKNNTSVSQNKETNQDAEFFENHISKNIISSDKLLNISPLNSDKINDTFIESSFFKKSQFSHSHFIEKPLECIVTILNSMYQWSTKDPNSSSGSNKINSEENIKSPKNEIPNEQTEDDPSEFASHKKEKIAYQRCVESFKYKPKKGIDKFIENGFIKTNDPIQIAKFLLNSKELDKESIGEYLGEGDKFNIEIMHHFVDLFDFCEIEFVEALRMFLKTFRLPGESQKIDRFMLKFAERFTVQNPDVFNNADAAYVLAYSVILLNTDLHNNQVKKRMSLGEFIKNNRGINDSTDLPDEYLTTIYNDINNNEIKLSNEKESSEKNVKKLSFLKSFQIKRHTQENLTKEISFKTEKLLKQNFKNNNNNEGETDSKNHFYSASHSEHIKPMIELTWMAFLAALSSTIRQSKDNSRIQELCLEGFEYVIKICSIFDLHLAKKAFITTLTNLCSVKKLHHFDKMNLNTLQLVLKLPSICGNNLKECWIDVFSVITNLYKIQIVSEPERLQRSSKNSNMSGSGNNNSINTLNNFPLKLASAFLNSSTSKRESENMEKYSLYLEESNSQNIVMAVDKVFTSSVDLDGSGIVDFVTALCKASENEIESLQSNENKKYLTNKPLMFQKIVDITYHNMNRIRIEWTNMWNILGPHFNKFGTHKDKEISSFVLDSLRQLSIKFLEKNELQLFQFQKEFLAPFYYIYTNNPSTRDMLISCLQQIIKLYGINIKSGWKPIINILHASAVEESEDIVILSFETVKIICRPNILQLIVQNNFINMFLNSILQFTKECKVKMISMQGMEVFKLAIDNGTEIIAQNNNKDDLGNKFWEPVIKSLLNMMIETEELEQRNKAVTFMFEILQEFGVRFSDKMWTYLVNEVIFDEIKTIIKGENNTHNMTPQETEMWCSTTFCLVIENIVNLYHTQFTRLNGSFVNNILQIIELCIENKNNYNLTPIGIKALKKFTNENKDYFTDKDWHKILAMITRLLKNSLNDKNHTSPDLKGTNPRTNNKTLFLLVLSVLEGLDIQKLALLTNNSNTETTYLKEVTEYIEEWLTIIRQTEKKSKQLKEIIQEKDVREYEIMNENMLYRKETTNVLIKIYFATATTTTKNTLWSNKINELSKNIIERLLSLNSIPFNNNTNTMFENNTLIFVNLIENISKIESEHQFISVYSYISNDVIEVIKFRHINNKIQNALYNLFNKVNSLFKNLSEHKDGKKHE